GAHVQRRHVAPSRHPAAFDAGDEDQGERASMYLGHQMGNISDEKLKWAAQMGVQRIACESRQGIEREDGTWDVQGIRNTQQRLANWGITMDVLALALPSVPIARQRFPHIMLG